MNILSRAITARFFPKPDSYNAFRKHWSAFINSERKHELSAAHHLLYLALIGKDWRKAFTPPTNPRKLDNGAFQGWEMFRALQTIQFKFREEELIAPFGGSITSEMLDELRDLLSNANPYSYKQPSFADGSFPFEAYSVENKTTTIVHVHKEKTDE